MIKVTNEVTVYEIDGSDAPMSTKIVVQSHWASSSKRVVLVMGGKSYTVEGYDLAAAIENAQNRGMP